MALTNNREEPIKFSIPAEVWATTSNPIANMIAKIVQFINMLFGHRERAQLIVTNKRVVLETQSITWYCIEAGASFTTYLPQSISSVGYAYSPMFLGCLCRKYVLAMNFNSGTGFNFVLKGGERQATEVCNAMIAALVK